MPVYVVMETDTYAYDMSQIMYLAVFDSEDDARDKFAELARAHDSEVDPESRSLEIRKTSYHWANVFMVECENGVDVSSLVDQYG